MRNPISVEAFAEWCERKPADEGYDFDDSAKCAFAIYLRAIGIRDPFVGGFTWRVDLASEPEEFPHPDMPDALVSIPHTYGALAARLRELAEA